MGFSSRNPHNVLLLLAENRKLKLQFAAITKIGQQKISAWSDKSSFYKISVWYCHVTLRTSQVEAAPPGKIFSIFTTGWTFDSIPPDILIPAASQQHKSEVYLEAYINNVIFNLNIGSKYKNVCHTVSIFQCFSVCSQDQSIPCILLQHNAFLQHGIMFWEPGYRGAGYHMKIKHVSLFPASDFFRNTFHWIFFLICDKICNWNDF